MPPREQGSTNLQEHQRLVSEVATAIDKTAPFVGVLGTVHLSKALERLEELRAQGTAWEEELNRQAELLQEANTDLEEARAEAQMLWGRLLGREKVYDPDGSPSFPEAQGARTEVARSAAWPRSDEPYSHQADGVNEQEPRRVSQP